MLFDRGNGGGLSSAVEAANTVDKAEQAVKHIM
jgi:hypothetical protein